MLGPAIFVAFFLLFTLISAAVPIPMFPGNMVPTWIGFSTSPFTAFLGAITNGVVYGFIMWLAFDLGSRKFKRADLEEKKK